MNETAWQRMERHRKAWHEERNILAAIMQEFRDLTARWQAARASVALAHQQYKDTKAVWRTGRECNITDADNAAMVHKMRQQ